MFKFVHASDLHLDSPLRGLERYEGAPTEQLRGATRGALKGLVDLALEEQVAFVLLAGDLYDGDWRDYNTGLFFGAQLARLREAGIQAFIVYGNHDAASRMTRSLHLPDNAHAFRTSRPETRVVAGHEVAIHGQGFGSPEVPNDLTAAYPAARRDCFNIGMLHTSLDGREGHDPYAPTSRDVLVAKGYDYWALGHVHRREIVHRAPWIVFPGNTQGRHARETGSKGCTLVTVSDAHEVSLAHRPLEVLRWERLEVSAEGAATPAVVLERVGSALRGLRGASGETLTAARVEVTGACRAHQALAADPARWVSEVRALGAELGGEALWLEKVAFRTSSEASLDELLSRDDAVGELMRSLNELDHDAGTLGDLTRLFDDVHGKLPPELRQGEEPLDLKDPESLRLMLGDVRQILLSHLLTEASR